jgi:LuxR family maltose regulon positive regulatory protein
MPEKVNHTPPTVISGVLYTDDEATTGARVGSPAWFAWLTSASTFYYEGPGGAFTARHETRQRGGAYWFAYRKEGGRLHNCYLGKAEALTVDKLAEAALRLAGV